MEHLLKNLEMKKKLHYLQVVMDWNIPLQISQYLFFAAVQLLSLKFLRYLLKMLDLIILNGEPPLLFLLYKWIFIVKSFSLQCMYYRGGF